MDFMEIVYFILNRPYFRVSVLSNGRRVKTFIQSASDGEKGKDFFLICKDLKAAWFKPEKPVIDGIKFVTFVNLKNAIPLKIEDEIIIETGEFINKEKSVSHISIDTDKNMGCGKPMGLTEINYPSTLLFQVIEAHLVKEIQSVPPSKWEEMKWVFIAGIVVAGFLLWQLMMSGIKF